MTALPSSSEADAPYVLGRTAPEHARLWRQARDLEPLTVRLLDQVGLSAAMRCLDVGCGPGAVMRLMAERVGDSGLGNPDGITADGLLQPIAEARPVLEATYRSVLPLALRWGITSQAQTDDWLADLAAAPAGVTVRLPLLIGAFKRKPSTHHKP